MRTDVAIIGGGPGGSTAAMFLAQAGIRATIIEKQSFPRYHIGESMTGECGAIVRALGLEDKMLECCHPTKRGVTVWGPEGRNPWHVPVMARRGSQLVDAFTWQVRRSKFDLMLLEEATARGTQLIQAGVRQPLLDADGGVRGLRIAYADGRMEDIDARVVIDASGQSAFLSNAGVAGKRELGRYDKQIAIFSQVPRTTLDNGMHQDDTHIFYRRQFHWAWYIPLDAETVSVGIVVPAAYFREKGESRREFFLREMHDLNPELTRRVPDETLTEDVRAIPNYSYEVRPFTGKGWVCIGDAHRFIDPIFSFGLYVTMKEAQLAADAIADYLVGSTNHRDTARPFAAHEEHCERALNRLQDLIDAFWEEPHGFALLVQQKYRPDFIDMFAGRMYDDGDSVGMLKMQSLAERARQRQTVAV